MSELKKGGIYILFFLCGLAMNSQNNEEDFTPTVHSPEVTAFERFIEFPVSLYTGQAEVSVPIYNLTVGDISVPINLQYQSGGVRVEDVSSWVGSNWSLNAGGKVSRQINGASDFSTDWFYKAPTFSLVDYYTYEIDENESWEVYKERMWDDELLKEAESTLELSKLQLLEVWYKYGLFVKNMIVEDNTVNENYWGIIHSARGDRDSQHDMFYYSAGKYSGKFIIDHDNGDAIVTFPKEDIQISPGFKGKIIKTPDGLIYTYENYETNLLRNDCGSGAVPMYQGYEHTAWFLSRIESSTTGAFVDFVYEDKNLKYRQNGSQTDNVITHQAMNNIGAQLPDNLDCELVNDINTHRLDSIKSSDGQIITFIKGDERKDLEGDFLLEGVIIENEKSSLKKQFKINHEYLLGDQFYDLDDAIFDNITDEMRLNTRLFLKGVEEVGNDGTSIPVRKFEYNVDKGLPSRMSYSQDHFGYFNGKINKTLIPFELIADSNFDGADRTPDFKSALEGSLNLIKTSTGGERHMTYGLNKCDNCNSRVYGSPDELKLQYQTDSSYDIEIPNTGNTPMVFEKDVSFSGNTIIKFRFEGGSESFYPNNSNLVEGNAQLKLLFINEDGTTTDVFNSSSKREQIEYSNNGTNSYLILESEEVLRGDYKIQLIINNWDWWTYLHEYDESYEFSLSTLTVMPFDYNFTVLGGRDFSGLRVEKMDIYDPIMDEKITKVYEYGKGYTNSASRYHRPAKVLRDVNGELYTMDYVKRSSSPNVSFSQSKGGIIGYDNVTVREIGNGFTKDYFTTVFDFADTYMSDPLIYDGKLVYGMGSVENFLDNEWNYPFAPKDDKDWKRGLLKKQQIYSEEGRLLKEVENTYHFYDDKNSVYSDSTKVKTICGFSAGSEAYKSNGFGGYWGLRYYQLQSSWYDLAEVKETNYLGDGSALTTVTKNEYSEHQRTVKTTEVTNSNGDVTKTTNYYPTDSIGSSYDVLLDKHMLYKPVSRTTEINDLPASKVEYNFSNDGVNVLLKSVNYFSQDELSNAIYIGNDSYGNISEITKANGISSVYLWGYNNAYPIAKIENATELEVFAAIDRLNNYTSLEEIKELSKDDTDDCMGNSGCNEAALRNVLRELQGELLESQMTYYTYNPLAGITSITDPRGQTMYYQYDAFNRLEQVVDSEGHILSKTEYHYIEESN